MKISLIGMSGSGKSYWSKKLQTKGFKRFCCDDLIEEKLRSELKASGYHGIQDVAKWMGQPFDKQYKGTSKRYLQYENEVMNEVIRLTQHSHSHENIVIDTTGSVIYAGNNILEKLIRFTKVIYLDTPDSVKNTMYQLYLQDPKPVIWGKFFKKGDNEYVDALGTCYPKLLAYRSQKYEKLSSVKLDYHMIHSPKFTVEMFMEVIQ